MDEGIVSGGDYEQKAEKERRTHRGGRSDCGEQRVGRGVEWREWVKMTGKKINSQLRRATSGAGAERKAL